MSYFFRTNNFQLDEYDFDIIFEPKLTKSERELFKSMLGKFDFKSQYSITNIKDLGIDNKSLKRLSKNLLKKVISCTIKNKKGEEFKISFNIFDFIIFENTQLIYNFSNEIKNSISYGSFFARVNILAILSFESQYTLKLFKILIKELKDKGSYEFSLDEFKALLNIDSDQYSRFYNLETKILNPIINDLNENHINMWFEKVKNSSAKTSRVIGIKLHYVNQAVSKIHKDTNALIKKYSGYINDFPKAYDLIYSFKKFNTFEDTVQYIEDNKDNIFG